MATPTKRSASRCECPICFERLLPSKLLECGHTLCEKCTSRLYANGTGVKCPTCNYFTTKPPNELPRNFALEEMLHQEEINASKKFSCFRCNRKTSNDDFISCLTCNIDVCHRCITLSHQGHKINEIDDFLEKKEKEYAHSLQPVANHVNAIRHRAEIVTDKVAKLVIEIEKLKDAVVNKNLEFIEGMTQLNKAVQETSVGQFINEQRASCNGEVINTLERRLEELSIFETNQTALDNSLSCFFNNVGGHLDEINNLMPMKRNDGSSRSAAPAGAVGSTARRIGRMDLNNPGGQAGFRGNSQW